MRFYTPLSQTARDWFAGGYRLRVTDIDTGMLLTDRSGFLHYVIERSTYSQTGRHALVTRENGIERTQEFGPHDTVDLFYAEAPDAANPPRML